MAMYEKPNIINKNNKMPSLIQSAMFLTAKTLQKLENAPSISIRKHKTNGKKYKNKV